MASGNKGLQPISECFCVLAQALILDDNRFTEWAALRRLSGLPCLRRLSLAGNKLTAIQHPATGVLWITLCHLAALPSICMHELFAYHISLMSYCMR